MKITTVTYQKTYSIGPYLTDRIGLEASLEPTDSVEDTLHNLRAKADEWHKAEHPNLYQENQPSPIPERPFAYRQEPIPTISKDTERLEIEIDNATSLEELQYIKDQCGKAGLMGQWISKFNNLNNGNI